MLHGIYISEFEQVLAERGYAISQHSLSDLVDQIDFSRLSTETFADRILFYKALSDTIQSIPRGESDDGLGILGETDALAIVNAMSSAASARSLRGNIRDIWCRIFIGGCP